jgi:hypothetical protein
MVKRIAHHFVSQETESMHHCRLFVLQSGTQGLIIKVKENGMYVHSASNKETKWYFCRAFYLIPFEPINYP